MWGKPRRPRTGRLTRSLPRRLCLTYFWYYLINRSNVLLSFLLLLAFLSYSDIAAPALAGTHSIYKERIIMNKRTYFSIGTGFHASLAFLLTIGLGLSMLSLAVSSQSPTNTDQTITAKALTSHSCNATEWHFVITQVDTPADAPASIHVTWDTGAQEDVPLLRVTGGTAHYLTTDNLNANVTSATASIYSSWHGQFNLSHGPCGNPISTPVPPTPTTEPSPSPQFGVW